MIRSLGGASVSNCLQQALKSVFFDQSYGPSKRRKNKKGIDTKTWSSAFNNFYSRVWYALQI
jgi:hypothetical protein